MKKSANPPIAQERDFSEVLKLIQAGRFQAYRSINVVMIETYWSVGAYLSRKVAEAGWGKGVVKELSSWLLQKAPDIKGYSAQNLWRMKQLFELYHANPKLSALLRELSWTNHCMIMAQCKTLEEKEFYVQAAAKARWSSRELENQIKRAVFERTALASQKLSPAVRELPQDVSGVFKDSYLIDFINLPEPYLEKDLQEALLKNLCRFLLSGKKSVFKSAIRILK